MSLSGQRVTGAPAVPVLGKIFMGLALIGCLAVSGLVMAENGKGRNVQAEGTIVEYPHDGYPLVQFTASGGQTVRFRNSVRSTAWKLGGHLPVAYNPSSPTEATVDGFAGRWFLPVLFGALSGLFLVVSVVMIVVGPRLR